MALARRLLVLTGTLVVVGGVLGLFGPVRSSATTTGAMPSPTSQRACIRRTMEDDLRLHAAARAESVRDLDAEVIERDGDDSWVEHAHRLGDLDLTDCPAVFRAAFARWVTQWTAIGEDARDGADWSAVVLSLQRSDDALAAAAAEAGVDLPHRTWSVPAG